MARPPKGKIALEQIAKKFNVTKQAVAKWVKAGCPTDSLESVDQWRKTALAEAETLNDVKRRKILLECERLAVIVKREHGELILRSDVYEAGVKLGATLSAEIRSACADLPAQLVGLPDENAVRVVLDKRLNQVLSNFKTRAIA
jgi:transposase